MENPKLSRKPANARRRVYRREVRGAAEQPFHLLRIPPQPGRISAPVGPRRQLWTAWDMHPYVRHYADRIVLLDKKPHYLRGVALVTVVVDIDGEHPRTHTFREDVLYRWTRDVTPSQLCKDVTLRLALALANALTYGVAEGKMRTPIGGLWFPQGDDAFGVWIPAIPYTVRKERASHAHHLT